MPESLPGSLPAGPLLESGRKEDRGRVSSGLGNHAPSAPVHTPVQALAERAHDMNRMHGFPPGALDGGQDARLACPVDPS